MKQDFFARRFVGLGVAVASLALFPGQAAAATCPNSLFSQPLLSFGDAGWYTLAPGESVDNFAGTGWSLSGGARIVTTTLADGARGAVLDLPAGGAAVSPPTCVTNDYPTARALVRNVTGGWGVQ